jgi:lipoate-protein ligase A
MTDTLREIDITIDAASYPAVERTMLDRIAAGSSEPTIMDWTFGDDLFISLAPVQDAGLIDTEQADDEGIEYSRRFNMAGSIGFFKTDHTPTLYAFFPDEGERTLSDTIALAGTAMAEALQDAGIDRVYYDGGDLELEAEDQDARATKIGVSGAVWHDGVWGVFVNLIKRNFSPEEFETLDSLVRLPKVKFEDKDTDSVAGRMGSVENELPGIDVDNLLATAKRNFADRLGRDLSHGELTAEERDAIDDHKEYYGSSEYFESVSTANLVADADDEHRIAEVAYKARKLVKASVVVDQDDVIVDALYTGDMYHKPRAEALEWLNEAIVGLDVDDADGQLEAIQTVFEDDDFAVSWMEPEDFQAPLNRVQENLTPVTEFNRE